MPKNVAPIIASIPRNALASVTQVIITGIGFFIVYRFLLDNLGIELLGVWSLVLAATSVSRIGELGLAAGVVRFVAQALALDNFERAGDVVQTAVITIAILMASLLIACYSIFETALRYLLPSYATPIAFEILPYSLLSLWCTIVASVFTGALDGCQRMDLRSALMIIAHVFYVTLAITWVPQHGLTGVAYAQLTQAVILAVLSWWVLRRQIPGLPIFPFRWSFGVFRQIAWYGASFQVITIMGMIFDPLTKGLMSKFGGLAALGYYEMAYKLLIQARGIIVEGNRVIVPTISALQQSDPHRIGQLYIRSYRIIFFLALVFFSCLAIALPAISFLWIGAYNPEFVRFSLLLTAGWFINTLIGPAFFSNLGTGNLRPNVISQIIVATLGGLFSVTLGSFFGAYGVVIGSVLGLALGSLFLIISYSIHAKHDSSFEYIPRDLKLLFFVCVTAVCLSSCQTLSVTQSDTIIVSLSVTIFVLSLSWTCVIRKELFARIKL